MKGRLRIARAWLDIQRARVANLIYPHAFVEGWTPRTVTEWLEDDDLRLRMEALNREWAAMDERTRKAEVQAADAAARQRRLNRETRRAA